MERLQARADLLNFIKIISESCDIKNGEIVKVQTNQKGEGYLGEIFLVTICDQLTKKQIDLVIKAAFSDQQVREFVPIRESFENEIYAYSTIFPQFEEFLKSKGLKLNEHPYKFLPKCYQFSLENGAEVLILENLRSHDFQLFDKYSILDAEHIALIFKTYGYFHGISLAFKDQQPDEYARLTDKIKDVYSEFMKIDQFEGNLQTLVKTTEDCLVTAQYDDMLKNFKKYASATMDLFQESLASNCKNSVILHGDCWSNNMMFKYDNSTRKLTDIRLLDFQLMKCGNPVCDLSYCLYSGASKEVFDQLDDYLLIYHQSLSDIVRRLGSDPDKLLSLDDLKNDWKQYGKFGLLMSLLILRMKATKQEDLIDMTDAAMLNDIEAFIKTEFDEKEFCRKAVDVVRNLYDYGAL